MENGQDQLQKAQKDVDDVTVIMLENLDKVKEREGKLGELENRADELREKSKMFSKTAVQVKNKKRFENMKWKFIMIGCGVAVIVVIIIIFLVVFLPSGGNS